MQRTKVTQWSKILEETVQQTEKYKDIHVLIPETCEHVDSWQKGFAHMIKDLETDYPGFSVGPI